VHGPVDPLYGAFVFLRLLLPYLSTYSAFFRRCLDFSLWSSVEGFNGTSHSLHWIEFLSQNVIKGWLFGSFHDRFQAQTPIFSVRLPCGYFSGNNYLYNLSSAQVRRIYLKGTCKVKKNILFRCRSSGHNFLLLTQRSQVPFPAIPDFVSSSRSGTWSTQPLWR
jgi:hypothetical protein